MSRVQAVVLLGTGLLAQSFKGPPAPRKEAAAAQDRAALAEMTSAAKITQPAILATLAPAGGDLPLSETSACTAGNAG